MDLLPDDEQLEIAKATADYLTAEHPRSRLHAASETPEAWSPAAWKSAAELGWLGLALPETHGGVGCTLAEESLLFRELGRFLAPPSLCATALAAQVALAADEPALALAFASGARRAAFAESRIAGPVSSADAAHVFDVAAADCVLVLSPDAASIYDAPDLASAPRVRCIDETVSLAERDPAAGAILARATGPDLWLRGGVLVAAQLVGLAEAARDDATGYAKEREQFGKPIGTFQAVKHMCADTATRCEAASTQLFYAALSVRDGSSDAAFQVSAALVLACDAARRNAEDDVQVHGGYGFTVEYDAQFFVKRAHVIEKLAGGERAHLELVAGSDGPLAA